MSEQRRMTFSLTLVNRCNNSRRFKDFSDFRLFYFGLMLAGHEGPFSLLTSVIRIVCILSRWKHEKNFHAIVRDNRYEQRAAKNQELICSRCETFRELDCHIYSFEMWKFSSCCLPSYSSAHSYRVN